MADLASSQEQLIYVERQLLGRIKKRTDPNERDAFLTWIMQAVNNKTRWRRFKTDVKQMVCR
jgi:hypothetical protein